MLLTLYHVSTSREITDPGGHVESWRWPAENHYVLQVEAFNRAVLEHADWPLPLEFSRGTQAWIDHIRATATA